MDSTAPLPTQKLEKASGDHWKCLQHTTFAAALYACSERIKQLLALHRGLFVGKFPLWTLESFGFAAGKAF